MSLFITMPLDAATVSPFCGPGYLVYILFRIVDQALQKESRLQGNTGLEAEKTSCKGRIVAVDQG